MILLYFYKSACQVYSFSESTALSISSWPSRNTLKLVSWPILHFCRALQDLEEGRITSKKEAMEWAKRCLDPKWHDLIDYSWNERKDESISKYQPANRERWEETLEFAKYALEKIKE